jgi:hypothetical protein
MSTICLWLNEVREESIRYTCCMFDIDKHAYKYVSELLGTRTSHIITYLSTDFEEACDALRRIASPFPEACVSISALHELVGVRHGTGVTTVHTTVCR